jgi:hypothetical protein
MLFGLLPVAAETVQKGNLRVSFGGNIAPRRLPRTGLAPVSVQVEGKVTTTDRATPPKLETITIEINGHGRLDSTGLARCSLKRLESISSSDAKRVCGAAQVGHGNVTSRVTLPGQGAFASNGPLLAFNGRYHGKQAIFAQVSSTDPLPLTYVIVFRVSKKNGTFGTELTGALPPIASEYGYISAFDLELSRTYDYRGRRRSYASAYCPAPQGFAGASFPFARAGFQFADGRTLTSTVERECKVKG